jgi:DNA-binding Lrp family transcriptional regulator
MQTNPNPWRALLAHAVRIIADNQPVTLLELADLCDVSHGDMHRTVDELERLGVIKQYARFYEMRLSNRQHVERAIKALAEGRFKPKAAA